MQHDYTPVNAFLKQEYPFIRPLDSVKRLMMHYAAFQLVKKLGEEKSKHKAEVDLLKQQIAELEKQLNQSIPKIEVENLIRSAVHDASRWHEMRED